MPKLIKAKERDIVKSAESEECHFRCVMKMARNGPKRVCTSYGIRVTTIKLQMSQTSTAGQVSLRVVNTISCIDRYSLFVCKECNWHKNSTKFTY